MSRAPDYPVAVLGSAEAMCVAVLVYGKSEGSLHRLHRLGTGASQLHGAYYYAVVLTCMQQVLVRRGARCVGAVKIAYNLPLAVSRFQSTAAAW